MSDTTPLRLQDGWAIADLDEANLDARSLSNLTRLLDEGHEYPNTHAVLIEHAEVDVQAVAVRAFERFRPVDLGWSEAFGFLIQLGLDTRVTFLGRHLDDARKAIAISGVDSVSQKRVGFLDVPVGRAHEVLVHCVRPR